MTQFSTITTEIVYPDSNDDINLEIYEWFLVWYSREGVPAYWLFCDWEVRNEVETNPINLTDEERISSLINRENRIVTLTAEDLKRDEMLAFTDAQISKNMWRAFRKDSVNFEAGGVEKIAVLSSDIVYVQSKQRFNVTLQVQRYQKALAK
jgi:hypothetical protein